MWIYWQLNVCMYICMYACIYVCLYVCMCVWMSFLSSFYLLLCMCVCMCMYVCMYVYVCMYICVYVCMYMCMNVCIYICMHKSMKVYIHIQTFMFTIISFRMFARNWNSICLMVVTLAVMFCISAAFVFTDGYYSSPYPVSNQESSVQRAKRMMGCGCCIHSRNANRYCCGLCKRSVYRANDDVADNYVVLKRFYPRYWVENRRTAATVLDISIIKQLFTLG